MCQSIGYKEPGKEERAVSSSDYTSTHRFKVFFDKCISTVDVPKDEDIKEFRIKENKRLGLVINEGRIAKNRLEAVEYIRRYPILKKYIDIPWEAVNEEEISKLKQEVINAVDARNKIASLNIPLIYSVAADMKRGSSWIQKYYDSGLEMYDLFMDGYMGLLESIWKWDCQRSSLCSFVWNAIDWNIQDEYMKRVNITMVGEGVILKIRYLKESLLFLEPQQKIDIKEFAKRKNINEERITRTVERIKQIGIENIEIELEKLMALIYGSFNSISFEGDIYGEGISIEEKIVGAEGKEIIEGIIQVEVVEQVGKFLDELEPRDAKILRKHFFEGLSLEKIGKEVDNKMKSSEENSISRERVRQLELIALNKLSRTKGVKKLAVSLGINGEKPGKKGACYNIKKGVEFKYKLEEKRRVMVSAMLKKLDMPDDLIDRINQSESIGSIGEDKLVDRINLLDRERLLPFITPSSLSINYTRNREVKLKVLRRKKKKFENALSGVE